MHVVIAQTSGFCNGVKRAMRIAVEAACHHHGLQADGPLVHNEQAIELLSLHGIGSPDAHPDKPMLVRAHGVAPERRSLWQEQGLELVDATCAHVAANQARASKMAAKGYAVLLAGDPEHAEVRAVAASAGPDCRILSTPEDVDALDDIPEETPVFLLAQTTFGITAFKAITEAVRRQWPGAVTADTICRATHDRQEEAARLAGEVEVMVVVGGRHSANTGRLADTVRAAGRPVFLVETADELCERDFVRFGVAGVTSGASTPGWITQEVVNRLRGFGKPRWRALLTRTFLQLVQSRLTTGAAAAGLALAAQYYCLEDLHPALAAAGAGYVFFSHTLNRRVPPDPAMRRLSLVDAFYQKRRGRLLPLAWAAAGTALLLAARQGIAIFLLFLLALAATVLYRLDRHSVTTLSRQPRAVFSPRHWAMALGWALTLAAPAALEGGAAVEGLGAGIFIFLICLGGTLLRDLHDVASDRLLGIDTLAAGLGPAKAQKMVRTIFSAALALPFAACFAALYRGDAPGGWYCFILACAIAPMLGLYLLDSLRNNRLRDAVLLQSAVDAMGMAPGLAALIAALAAGGIA